MRRINPHADKIGVRTGGDGSDDIMVRPESRGVGYYQGEV